MILIWRFGECIKIAKLTYAIINPFILQAWVSLHIELKFANLKFRQQRFLSKPPNILFANISAYTVCNCMTYTTEALILTAEALESLMQADAPTKQLPAVGASHSQTYDMLVCYIHTLVQCLQ